MKKQLYKILLLATAGLIIGYSLSAYKTQAQDTHFSQFYFSPLTMNPALAGAFNGNVRLITNYRDQWQSVTTPYKTFAFSCDMGMFKKKVSSGFLGAGISFLSDKAGDSELGLNQANLSLAYHVQVSGYNSLSAGIQCGYAQRNINFEKLTWDNQFDGSSYNSALPSNENTMSNNLSYLDLGAGLQWTYAKGEMYSTANTQLYMNAGISVFHLNQPNISFNSTSKDNLPLKLVMHSAFQIGIKNSRISLAPSFLFMQQGSLQNIVVGTLIRYKLIEESKYTGFIKGAAISFGGHYRTGDAFIPSVQLEIAQYAIGISYDINTSNLKNASYGKGGIEFSLRFYNPNPFTGKSISKTPRLFN
jgi:type IX secretion system PorP/SprF family membrane protein